MGMRINGLPPPASMLRNQATKLARKRLKAIIGKDNAGTHSSLWVNPVLLLGVFHRLPGSIAGPMVWAYRLVQRNRMSIVGYA
jgi:hypothetical protein